MENIRYIVCCCHESFNHLIIQIFRFKFSHRIKKPLHLFVKGTPLVSRIPLQKLINFRVNLQNFGGGSDQGERVMTIVAMNEEAQTRLVHHR